MNVAITDLQEWIAKEERAWALGRPRPGQAPRGRPLGKSRRGLCQVCGQARAVRLDGTVVRHKRPRSRQRCPGSLRRPQPPSLAWVPPGQPAWLTMALVGEHGIRAECQADGEVAFGLTRDLGSWLPPWLAEHVHKEGS